MSRTLTVKKDGGNVVNMQPKPWPTQQEVQRWADRLDLLRRHQAKLEMAIRNFRPAEIAEYEKLCADGLAIYGFKDLAKLEARFNDFEPEEWYDEDGNVHRPSVSKMLAILMGSFTTSNIPDAAVFTRVMLDDVMAEKPSYVVLESACRKLRKTVKFMPAISEVIAAIESEQAIWSKRLSAFDMIDGLQDDLRERIAKHRRIEAERKLPILTGDRVHHDSFGLGVVVSAENDGMLDVEFDKGGKRTVVRSFLRRIGGAAE